MANQKPLAFDPRYTLVLGPLGWNPVAQKTPGDFADDLQTAWFYCEHIIKHVHGPKFSTKRYPQSCFVHPFPGLKKQWELIFTPPITVPCAILWRTPQTVPWDVTKKNDPKITVGRSNFKQLTDLPVDWGGLPVLWQNDMCDTYQSWKVRCFWQQNSKANKNHGTTMEPWTNQFQVPNVPSISPLIDDVCGSGLQFN